MINRRTLLTTALTLGAMKAFPGLSYAQARPLVFATFTGSWEEAHKAVLVPAFRKANADASIVLDPMLSVDQIAKVNAARANPPIDVMLHDPGPALVAIGQDIVEPFPVEKSTYYKDLIAEAQEPMGPAPFFQVVGLTYNPDTIKTPPTSWADLWKPEFKGKVGITNLNSTLGTGWLVEIAKMHGGSEANIDPGFKALEALKPNLAAVAANPGALATLFQQGQIDISPGNFNAIQILKARGVPVEFVAPKEGAIAFKTTIHVVKNSPNKELAFKLIEASLSPEVQTTLMNSPYLIVPTNAKVPMGGEIATRAGERHRRTEEEIRVPGLEEDQRAAFRLDRAVQPRNQALRITTMAAASVPRDVTSYGMGLAAPLALFFLVFFVAPLVQLLRPFTAQRYGRCRVGHRPIRPFPDRPIQPERAWLDAAARRGGDRLVPGAGLSDRMALPPGRIAGPDAHHPHRAAAAADKCRRPHLCMDRHPGPPGHHQLDAAFDRRDRYTDSAALHPGRRGSCARTGTDAADDVAADHRARRAST